jgi:uncharacterized protein
VRHALHELNALIAPNDSRSSLAKLFFVDELDKVWRWPRLKNRINADHAKDLLEQLHWRRILVELTTVPPRCRDPKDLPVLSTAIDGRADAIVSGDADLRDDAQPRTEMERYGVNLWGIDSLLSTE